MSEVKKGAFNKFDLPKLQGVMGPDPRVSYLELARAAEAAQRYQEMCVYMRELVVHCSKDETTLEVEERNLLSVAYKNAVGSLRSAHRAIDGEMEKDGEGSLLGTYKAHIEDELKVLCEDVLDLLENSLLRNGEVKLDKHAEQHVFYLKMAGDYYRYLAETQEGAKEQAASFYKKAMGIAEDKLQATHPIRLGLALNYSVCFYEILNLKVEACDLAKSAFDQAIAKLDKLEEADYKDSTLIMQLLRDNLTLWTTETNSEEAAN